MKNKFVIPVAALLLTTTTLTPTANACTRAFMNQFPGYMVSGRNLDFFGPVDPSLVITPRGVAHNGGEVANAAHWESRYGSVVIYADNLFPMDGINEKGLAGHTLYYTNGKQQQIGNQNKPVLQSRAWLSYILDNYATVDEAVKGLQHVRLVAAKLPIDYATDTKHIAIEDRSGDSAIIEIDNGVVHIYHGRQYTVLTNPPSFEKQLENLQKYQHVNRNAIPGTQEADARFVRASFNLHNLPQPDNKYQAQGFVQSALSNVAYPIGYPAGKEENAVSNAYEKYTKRQNQDKGVGTYWTTISDLSHGEYHFKSTFAPSEVYIKLSEVNFSAGQPVKRIVHLNDYALHGWEGNILNQAKAQ